MSTFSRQDNLLNYAVELVGRLSTVLIGESTRWRLQERNSMTSLLILGGTGWLGREVASHALARGIEVTCLARGSTGAVPTGARLVRADRSQPGAYDEVRSQDWDDVLEVTWQPGPVRAAIAALADRAAHWTFVSSGAVYREHGSNLNNAVDDVAPPTVIPLDRTIDLATDEQYGQAKAEGERVTIAALGSRALIARSGLIGGPGDVSDRFGYWASRFALAGSGPVLVPGDVDQPVQLIDARDLAAWLVAAGGSGTSGTFDAVGETWPLGQVLDVASVTAKHSGERVVASGAELARLDIRPWFGPRSLPLWLPSWFDAGFAFGDPSAAIAAGLQHHSLEQITIDTLADERRRGLQRSRRAGLTRQDELDGLKRLLRN